MRSTVGLKVFIVGILGAFLLGQKRRKRVVVNSTHLHQISSDSAAKDLLSLHGLIHL